jgi:hypothetical protein
MLYVKWIRAILYYSAGFVEYMAFDFQNVSKLRSISTSNTLEEDQQQVESSVLEPESRILLHTITGASSPQSFSQNAQYNLTYVAVHCTAWQCQPHIMWFLLNCCILVRTVLIDLIILFCWSKSYKNLHGLSSRANYTDRMTAACRRSDCQLFAERGCHVVSVTDPYGRILVF